MDSAVLGCHFPNVATQGMIFENNILLGWFVTVFGYARLYIDRSKLINLWTDAV